MPASNFFEGACYGQVNAPWFGDFAPRVSAVYDVLGNGRTVLKFSANRYNQPLSVDPVSQLNPITAPSDSRQWLPFTSCSLPTTFGCDRNNDGIAQLSEAGPAPGYVFSGINARYDSGIRRGIVTNTRSTSSGSCPAPSSHRLPTSTARPVATGGRRIPPHHQKHIRGRSR